MNKLINILCDCSECIVRKLYFANTNSDEMAEVCRQKSQFKFAKGENIFEAGETLNDFVYLKNGLLKYYTVLPNGKNQILSIAKPYDTVSLLTVFNKNKSMYHVSALEDSTLCYIPIEQITSIVKKNGDFALDFLMKLSEASNSVLAQQLLIKSKNLSGRIALVLLRFANEIYNNNTFELPISRSEIAEMIGMTSENVIRAMSDLRKDNIIEISGKQIKIIDPKKLEQIAQYG